MSGIFNYQIPMNSHNQATQYQQQVPNSFTHQQPMMTSTPYTPNIQISTLLMVLFQHLVNQMQQEQFQAQMPQQPTINMGTYFDSPFGSNSGTNGNLFGATTYALGEDSGGSSFGVTTFVSGEGE